MRGWRTWELYGVSWRENETHDEGLMEFGAEQALFPVVAHGASHGLGNGLLDAKRDPRLVVEELWVGMGAISARGREAHSRDGHRRSRGWSRRLCRGDWKLPVCVGRRLGAPDGAVLVFRSPCGGGGSAGRRRLSRCWGRTTACRRSAQRDRRRGQGRRVMRSVARGSQTGAGAKAVNGRRRRRGRACHGGRGWRSRCRGGLGKRDGGFDVRDNARRQVWGWRRGC